MYRIFSMDDCGRLYELGPSGWVCMNGMTFTSLFNTRVFLHETVVPCIPGELDSYIARVDSSGGIVKTFPILQPIAEIEE